MRNKIIYWFFGAVSFIVTLITYTMTMQPSTPFWDCGEFTAAITWQQVPHPPGTPLFVMVGKIFQILFPFGDLNWSANFVSVCATTFAVLLLYLIIVKVINNFHKEKVESIGDALSIYGSALIGSLAFCFTDTLWFNGVESEVYASTTLLTMLCVYLMMRWNEVADKPGHERYLLMLAYLLVLSSGVHLLAILTIYSIILVVYFNKYKINFKSFIIMGVIALVSFFLFYQVIIMWIPTFLAGNLPFKNEAKEYLVEGSPIITLLFLLVVIGFFYGWWWADKNKKILPKLVFSALILMLLGYTVNAHIMFRSNAHPVLNENEPKTFKRLVSYLGREQYGESKYWPRRFEWRDDAKIQYYSKYGKWYQPSPKQVTRKNGSAGYDYVFDKVDFAGEMNYLFKFQIDHMFFRYFYWNFVGRQSDVQDADASWFSDSKDADLLNFRSGYAKDFPVRFYALPLLFGLIGFFFHFYKDPKMAFSYLIMFLLMGVLAAIAQNQLERQPRERDYFYTGAFLVWCLWISLGTYSFTKYVITKIPKQRVATTLIAIILIASTLLVPVNMALGGWRIHSRAGNYLPFDFAYNLLQSCEKDAILFTAGDNDTFPLWNIQDVLGVRRDVRICNLSLGGTRWYVDELKNRTPWGAKKIPLPFSDISLQCDDDDERALGTDVSEPIQLAIDVPIDTMRRFTNDSSILANHVMKFAFLGEPADKEKSKYYYAVSHKMVMEILKQCKFDRPIYFSFTTGQEAQKFGLGKYIRSEGFAYRVLPVEVSKSITGDWNQKVMDDCLLNNIDNSNNYHTEPHYGFKFRNLNNLDVYYDEKHRENIDIYRNVYLNYSRHSLVDLKDSVKCISVLDAMEKNIGVEQFPLWYDEVNMIEDLYRKSGANDKADKIISKWVASMTDGDSQGTINKLLGYYNVILARFKQDNKNRMVQRQVFDMVSSIASIENQTIKDAEASQGKSAAISLGKQVYDKYKNYPDPNLKYISELVMEELKSIDSTAFPPPPQVQAQTDTQRKSQEQAQGSQQVQVQPQPKMKPKKEPVPQNR